VKLTEFLTDVGRPVAYYPSLRKVIGSTNATIFLCQFIYWTGKEASGGGWIFKTSEDVESEIGLSYDEQVTARKVLLKAELIQEKYKRLDHQMFFKVNMQNLDERWNKMRVSGIPETGNAVFGKQALPNSLIGNTETTTETTTAEETPKTIKRGDAVDGMIEMSQMPGIKSIIRKDAMESLIATRLGIQPTRRGWKDFLEFVDNRQQKDGQMLTTFLDWLTMQPKFDVSYWPPDKMRENWNRAFIETSNSAIIVESDGGFYG